MNYIKYMNNFWRLRECLELSHVSADFYFCLLNKFNRQGWKDELSLPAIAFKQYGFTTKQLDNARAELLNAGLIIVTKGTRHIAPKYKLVDVYKDNPDYDNIEFNADDNANDSQDCIQEDVKAVSNDVSKGTQEVSNNDTKQGDIYKRDTDTKIIKEKEKESFDAKKIVDESKLSEALKKVVMSWLEYKRERKQSYTSTGLKTLIIKLKAEEDRHGVDAVIDVITKSITNNWAGLFFDKIDRTTPTICDAVYNTKDYNYDDVEKEMRDKYAKSTD